MSWVRLNDEMMSNPKIGHLGDRAFRVYISMLCWCSRHETDGAFDDVAMRMATTVVRCAPVLKELIAAELIERTTAGYLIHDYLEYQPSRQRKAEQRDSAAERKRRSRRDAARPATETDAATSRARDPVPSRPDPVPIRSEVSLSERVEALTSEQQQLSDHLHHETQTKVLGGADAPQRGWCDDLILRGATRSDIDYALQETLMAGEKQPGKLNTKYIAVCLAGRVVRREAGHDPDEDTARTPDARGARGASAGRTARPPRAESRGAGWVDR